MAAATVSVTDKKLVRSKSGMKIVVLNENLRSPFLISEPQWIPDNECPQCMHCEGKFDFLRRRHHCRRCGKCYCSSCCVSKLPLPRMCFIDPVRQCLQCLEVTQKENDFFDKHLKLLVNGGTFLVTSKTDSEEQMTSCQFCRFSSDHRFLTFECLDDNGVETNAIEVGQIDSAKILTTSDTTGNKVATGIDLSYRETDNTPQVIQLECPDNQQRRQAMVWLASMQKAMKLMYEGRGSPAGLICSL